MKISITFFALLFNFFLFAQETENTLNISSLLNKDKMIELPTNAGFFTEKLGFEPNIFDCTSCKQGFYYQWSATSSYFLNYAQLENGTESLTINNFNNEVTEGLPFDLVFNSSDEEECYYLFNKYNPVRYQDSYEVSETENRAFSVLEFTIDKLYYKLSFLTNDKLTGVIISTAPIQ